MAAQNFNSSFICRSRLIAGKQPIHQTPETISGMSVVLVLFQRLFARHGSKNQGLRIPSNEGSKAPDPDWQFGIFGTLSHLSLDCAFLITNQPIVCIASIRICPSHSRRRTCHINYLFDLMNK